MALLVATAAAAQEPPSVTVIVPVVASSVGPFDTHWKTDVILQNDLKTEMTVALSLPAAKDQPAILLTIPGGRIQRFSDVVGEAFAMDNTISPLVVQTLGHHSVRVTASAYAIQGDHATKPHPVPVTDSRSFYALRVLAPLSYSDTRRTNIGLVNLGDKEAVISLALRTVSGTVAGATRVVLPPNGMMHLALQLMFPNAPQGENYSVLVETAAHDTYAYASVLDNTTNDAEFVMARAGVQ